ncbi:MAG: hypothetical protein IH623_31125 [Verrucomicrobia bacterium]|nr:hypothetical protein [Verrucomicrobiota bacterium]
MNELSTFAKNRCAFSKRATSLMCLLSALHAGWLFAAAGIQVEGTLVYSTAGPIPAGGSNEEQYVFKLTAQGQQWNIQMTPTDAEKRPIKYIEIGCDGEMMYAYHEQNVERVLWKDTNNVPIVPLNRGFAMIIPDTLPSPRFFRCEPLWLAYCSTCYFSTNHTGKARQIWLSGDISPSPVVTNPPVKAVWDWCAKGGQYLSRVEYFPESRPGGSADFPLVVFRVTQTKTVEGVEVPSQFKFIRYREEDVSKQIPYVTFSCQATNVIRIDSMANPKPRIAVPVIMQDYRFSGDRLPVPVVRHLVTNGLWLDKSEMATTKHFEIAKRVANIESSGQTNTPTKNRRRIILIAFVVASIVIFAFAMTKTSKR